ncbi:MAG: NAD-dependent epimerase/dehydratase family protein [Sandaracinaceae bacterium]|nr:NAD-dependent epimerase/dehydratase family protein [Myxococcales bacterium]MCB9658150.1 NAD-dependent epimerase/dehydratase family protein [Sandaracinaceae bacterium]
MRAFVTGGSGFLGSHIVDACLARGDSVRALVRPTSDTAYLRSLAEVELVVGDLSDEGALVSALGGIDVVYHSAARVLDYGSRAEFLEANVHGTTRLLAAAKRAGVPRFVFISSPSVVMAGADQVDVDESAPYPDRYLNLYSETKAIAERAVLAANEPGFTTCALRPRGVWGPRDLQGAMPKMVKRMHDGKLPNVSGGKRTVASICYCENAAEACMLAARSDRVGGKAYFVADAEPIDVWAFCDELAARFQVPPIARTLSPRVLWVLATVLDVVWRLPFLAHKRSPPMSRYLASLLIHSATYDLSAARRDFDYAPIVDRETGFKRIERWLGEGGPASFYAHL